MDPTIQQQKANVVKFFQEVLGNQNFDLIPVLLDPGYTYNGEPQTGASLSQWIEFLHGQYPGLQFVIEDILGEDETVALRWRMLVPVGPNAPTGGHIVGTNIIVSAGGKAISNCQNDMLGANTFVANPAG